MDKIVSRVEMQTILNNRPKGVPMDDVIKAYTSNGYQVEGINYEKPKPSLINRVASTVADYGKEAIQNPLETAKGVVKGVPRQAAALVKLAEAPGKFVATKLAESVGADTSDIGLDFKPVEELTAPSNKAQETGVFSSNFLPLGGATGAIKTGVTKGVETVVSQVGKASNLIKSTPSTIGNTFSKKGDEFVLDLVSPKATQAVKEEALKQGRVTEPGILKASKILPSKRDTELAESVKGFVSDKATPIENIDSVTNGVNAINTGVKLFVKENKVPFNTKQLTSQLNKGKEELNLIFASDANAEKTYNAIVKEFVKHVKSKDTSGLLDARQQFDKIPAIKKLLESQGLGENTKKEVVLTARSMANRYIADLLPKGNQFRETLLKEHKMIEAIGNIVDKNTGIIDANKLQLLTKEYPILKWVVSGLAGAAGVGVGGVVIGSTN